MLDPVSDWTSKFNNLPLVGDDTWAKHMAEAVDDLTTKKLEIPAVMGVPAEFTFDVLTFETELRKLGPVPTALEGATNFATAWQLAITTSILIVKSGAYITLPLPANTWSVVASTVIDPASIGAAKTQLANDILVIGPAESADDFAKAFREAFLNLTCSVVGLDSVSPPNGPQPLSLLSSRAG
jgi:hypothetical protein